MPWPFGRPKPLGQRGEQIARRLLRRAGLKVLARNYRCPAGEIDLIALDPSTRRDLAAETIVFVEVKTRTSTRYVGPEDAVDARKQRQIRRAADHYLAHHPTEGYQVRFDVVAIVLVAGQEPRIEHLPDAF